MTALRFTQQVAGTANLKVAHCDLEAATKLRRFTDRAQALVGLFAEPRFLGMEQIRVGARPAAADATAQLMHLAEA